MEPKVETKISKFLSLVLRHKPETIDLELDAHGWASVSVLLAKLQDIFPQIGLEQLKYVVENNNKQRFSFNEGQSKIRANQGHSQTVDLQLDPIEPPEFLFHGTATRNLQSISREGLKKMNRHHVHLSESFQTATQVGMRYGKPVVLKVMAQRMWQSGVLFYRTANGVWLTERVAPNYIMSN